MTVDGGGVTAGPADGPHSVVYERLARLQRVGVRLTAARTTDDVVAVVLDELAEAVGAAAATLSVLEPDRRTVRVVAARGFDDDLVARWSTFDIDSGAPMARSIRTGEALLLGTWDEVIEAFPDLEAEPHTADRHALAALPLGAEGEVFGAIGLSFSGERAFDEAEGRFLASLALQCAVAFDRSRAYEAEAGARAVAEETSARLLHVARTLQASLLPPKAPRIPGLEVASRFVAGGDGVEVGGDFYDVFPAGHPELGAWHIVIGDVRGKGVEAAALTGVVRSTIRSAAINEPSPAQMLAHLNEAMVRASLTGGAGDDGDPRFCTVVVGTVTPLPDGVGVELSVGGHPLPFLLRADGSTEQVGVAGTLLGVVADPVLVDARVELRPGDSLVLYTDGITERHADDRFFEEDGLAQVLARCAGFTATTLAERIETAARAFVEDEPRDDLAVLVVRVPERPASTTSASTDLPAHPLSARRARRFVLTALDAFAVRGLDDVAELLTSEVVTNAVVHAHSSVRVSVEGVDGGVRVSVSDTNPLIPALREPVDEAEHGRGLHLVDTLAWQWGVEPGEVGKSVWFELRFEDGAHP